MDSKWYQQRDRKRLNLFLSYERERIKNIKSAYGPHMNGICFHQSFAMVLVMANERDRVFMETNTDEKVIQSKTIMYINHYIYNMHLVFFSIL